MENALQQFGTGEIHLLLALMLFCANGMTMAQAWGAANKMAG